jgi:hypothetical protein
MRDVVMPTIILAPIIVCVTGNAPNLLLHIQSTQELGHFKLRCLMPFYPSMTKLLEYFLLMKIKQQWSCYMAMSLWIHATKNKEIVCKDIPTWLGQGRRLLWPKVQKQQNKVALLDLCNWDGKEDTATTHINQPS